MVTRIAKISRRRTTARNSARRRLRVGASSALQSPTPNPSPDGEGSKPHVVAVDYGNKRNIFGANARRLYPALAKVPVPA